MTTETKSNIIETYKKLINEELLNKITVSSICNGAGVNRQTFYYYYHDIMDIATSVVSEELYERIKDGRTYATWTDGFLETLTYMRENKTMIKNVYYSTYWNEAEGYFNRFNERLLDCVVRECAANMKSNIKEEDIIFIVHIYSILFQGVILEYIEFDMKSEPQEILDKILKMLSGDILRSIKSFENCD